MTQEEEIIDYELRLLEALKKGDIEVLDDLLHDNLIFNIPTGQSITKVMDIENYRSGNLIVYDITASDQIIKFIDDISTVVVTLHINAKFAEQIVEGKFRYLRVWKLFDNKWKVIAGSGMQVE